MKTTNTTIKILTFAASLILTANAHAFYFPKKAITFGPSVHYTFGTNRPFWKNLTVGFEVAYWDMTGDLMPAAYGLDAGVDFGLDAMRIYSEAQAGLLFAGASAGPVLEIPYRGKSRLGLQYSVWMNFIGGLNLRALHLNNQQNFSPGIYVKAPVPIE